MTEALSIEDQKYKSKYTDVKKQVTQLEELNDEMFLKIARAKKAIDRLRLERRLLLEKFESLEPTNLDTDHQHTNHASEEDTELDETEAEDEQQPAPKKRKTKRRDPKAPKRPANAFFMFCQLEREKMRSEFPEITRSELTKLMGSKWKNMSEDDKKQFYDLYEKDKERYASEMAEYVPDLPLKELGSQEEDNGTMPLEVEHSEADE